MPFRQRGNFLRPINSVKHIVETSNIIAAVTNTVHQTIVDGVNTYTLGDVNGVPTGSKVSSFYLSVYAISEGGEVANEVPLVDWYIIKVPGGTYGTTFDATNLPTPGATGSHQNKNKIIHTEKGLSGGGDASLSGVPMIFKGVIKIPKGMQRIAQDDQILLCVRTNFATKLCAQTIYKHYSQAAISLYPNKEKFRT